MKFDSHSFVNVQMHEKRLRGARVAEKLTFSYSSATDDDDCSAQWVATDAYVGLFLIQLLQNLNEIRSDRDGISRKHELYVLFLSAKMELRLQVEGCFPGFQFILNTLFRIG